MEKKRVSFVRGAVILGAAGLMVKLIGALFRIPLANAIGPIGSSYYEVAYPYYSGLLVISSSGLPTAISKMVSERVTVGDYKGAHRVFTTAMKLLISIGIITSALMFIGSGPLAAISTLDAAHYSFKALAPALFAVSIMCAYRGYLQGMQRMAGTAISQVVEQVGKLAIGLTLAVKMLPMGPEFAAMGALIGVTISEFMALISIIIVYRRYRPRIVKRLELSEEYEPAPITGKLIMLAVPITIGASISSLSGIADGAFIMRILTENLGYAQDTAQTAYALLRTNVTTLVNMPGVLTMALAMSLVPAISSAAARDERRSVESMTVLGLKLALIVGLPCAVGLIVLAEPILAMLYPNLSSAELTLAADLLHTAAIGVIFLSLVQSMTGVIQGLGRPNVPVFNLFIGFLLKVVSLIALMNIPSLNIQGASLSTVICYAFAGLSDTVYALRRTRAGVNYWDVVCKPLISTLLMGAMAYMCHDFIARMGHDTAAVIISIVIAVCVYATMAVYLKMFTIEELNYIPGGAKLRRIIYGGSSARENERTAKKR